MKSADSNNHFMKFHAELRCTTSGQSPMTPFRRSRAEAGGQERGPNLEHEGHLTETGAGVGR
jgi:hypothetical protein